MATKSRPAPLAYAYGGPLLDVQFKQQPEDFKVAEVLGFDADDDGHHWLIEVEKTNINTLDMLSQLAQALRVGRRTLGYSGLKDRHAIARQWLTVPSQGLERDAIMKACGPHWRVLQAKLHRKKLRVGSHRNNSFLIKLRDIVIDDKLNLAVESRLDEIRLNGVPNYFGPQRFGVDGSNLLKALAMFRDGQRLARQQHRFAVSAARSMLFNVVLSERAATDCWQRFVGGDIVALEGSRSWFELARLGDDGPQRLAQHDVHPSGPLWGRGALPTQDQAAAIEHKVAQQFEIVVAGLAALGLKQERRALRLTVTNLNWQWSSADRSLELVFDLPKGGFATSVLRELFGNRQFEFYWPEVFVSAFASST